MIFNHLSSFDEKMSYNVETQLALLANLSLHVGWAQFVCEQTNQSENSYKPR